MAERFGRTLNLDRALEQYDSKFRFVLLASARAEQVIRGSRPKLESTSKKPTRIAMEELREGLVEWSYGAPPAPEPAAEAEVAAPPAEAAGSAEQH